MKTPLMHWKWKWECLLSSQLHAAVLRAVFGVGPCCFHTARPQTLTLSSVIAQFPFFTVSAFVFVFLLLFVATGLLLDRFRKTDKMSADMSLLYIYLTSGCTWNDNYVRKQVLPSCQTSSLVSWHVSPSLLSYAWRDWMAAHHRHR